MPTKKRGGGNYSIHPLYHTLHYDSTTNEFYNNRNHQHHTSPEQYQLAQDAIPITQSLLSETDYKSTAVTDDNMIPSNPDSPLEAEVKPITWKIGNNLTEEQKLQVIDLLEENRDVFAFSLEELLPSNNTPMEIPLQTAQPIFQNSHRLSDTEWSFVRKNCQKLLELGMIRKSDSNNYASATVVVRKKDENGQPTDFRQCGDYRPINNQTQQDKYQLPRIEDIFQDMKEAKIFTKLDLRQGYHQIPIAETDKCILGS